MKKGIKTFLALGLLFTSMQGAFASKLPDNVWNYLKEQFPKASQRFDSVVIINNSTMYVPLYPAQKSNVQNLSVEYTYPKTTSIKNLPEVFILNNNYAFMKIFKDKNGNYTITKNENLPDKVKLGVFPQDMLVPTGLIVPENLKIILGNLLIPKKGDSLMITASDSSIGTDEEADIVPIVELKQTKTFFLNNKTKFVLVYDKGGDTPLYEIKLSGLPNKIIASPLTKFALTMYFGNKTAEIIDLTNERVVKNIDFENIPSDADIDKNTQIAYVTSARAKAIYLVDLNNASLLKAIKSDRMPNKISVSGEDKLLVFSDKGNENIYMMDLSSNEYSIKKIANIKNLSTLLIDNGRVLAISRTLNKAFIYKINGFEADNSSELVSELDLAEKPTDALIHNNKAFILCSKDGIINVYDFEQNKMLEPIKLSSGGFYSKINIIPDKDLAIISGINTKKVILLDLNNAKIEKNARANFDVADVVIIDKKPPVKVEKEEKKENEEL